MAMTTPPPKDTCLICKHYLGDKVIKEKKYVEGIHILYCKAFPDGIPDEIANGNNNHKLPFPGDHGIQFKKK